VILVFFLDLMNFNIRVAALIKSLWSSQSCASKMLALIKELQFKTINIAMFPMNIITCTKQQVSVVFKAEIIFI